VGIMLNIPSLFAVACFLPDGAKDLSAPTLTYIACLVGFKLHSTMYKLCILKLIDDEFG
jgi:hypothetical protein